jgi:DNA-binding response OmpR family regulator
MICTSCGFNLERERPVTDGPYSYDPIGTTFSVDGVRLQCRSQVSEMIGSMMQAGGRPLAYGVLAERLGYEGDAPVKLIYVLACEARRLITERGHKNPVETVRGYGLRWACA